MRNMASITKQGSQTPLLTVAQGDRNTKAYTFVVKRYDGEVDLSNLVWMLQIRNAEGVTDATALYAYRTEDEVQLTWNVGGHATTAEGRTVLQVCGFDLVGDMQWGSGEYYIEVKRKYSGDKNQQAAVSQLQELVNGVVRDATEAIADSVQATAAAQEAAQRTNAAIDTANQAAESADDAAEEARKAAAAAYDTVSVGNSHMEIGWDVLNTLADADLKTVLEAAQPVWISDVQAAYTNAVKNGNAAVSINGKSYTLRALGEVHDALMVKGGALVLCRKVTDDGTGMRTESTFETIAASNFATVIDRVVLPCTVENLLAGKLSEISYADCGAYLDGVHDDYEAMYRAHFIGDLCSCDVVQHGGTIYKANSGWLYVQNHNVDLTGCVMKIDAHNRYGSYWLNAVSIWTLEESVLAALRPQMTEYSNTWEAVETGFPANGLFVVRHPDAATRWNDDELTTEDRVELVRHACDGRVHSTVIDAADENTKVTFHKYPETQITFRGCTLDIDISMASVPLYFMRCERSNVVIRDFVINPTRRTMMNIGYRGAVFTLNECADIIMDNIKGINIAGRPRDEYPRGVAGYILNAVCVLDLTVRDCNLLGYWGCVGLNGAKEITFDGCELNRVDIHDYFRNLTINNCRIYGQTINFGYGKGAVNISNCSVLTNWVHQIVNLRCDYGRYFEGEINISNVDCVYNGPTYFDIVSGVTMFSAESAANTGLRMDRYPTINVANVTLRLLDDSTAGYVFNMPAALESTIQIADKRKVVEYVNVTAYDENGALLNLPACSLGGVVKDTNRDIKAAGAAAEAAQATANNALEKAVALEGEVSQLTQENTAIKNLDVLSPGITLEWTSGRMTTGAHVDNGKYRYSNLIDLQNIDELVFDDTVLKCVFVFFAVDESYIGNGLWKSASPAIPDAPANAHYARIEVTKQDGTGGVGDYIQSVQCQRSESYPLRDRINNMTAMLETCYVDGANGNDANSGTANAPYKTIGHAIEKGHSVIKVAPGEYAESLILSSRSDTAFCVWQYPTYAAESWDTPMVHINGGAEKNISRGVTMTECTNISFDGFWFDNTSTEPVYARDVFGLEMRNCIASNAGTDRNAFRLRNVSGRFVDCKAYNAYDGFNIHGYGDTTFENCVAYDCTDDGLSHHDACTGTVIGGEYYRCNKGGISTPTHNAVVNVYGAYCHDNTKYGIYIDAYADTEPHTKGIINGCLLKNNGFADLYVRNAEIVAWGNVYDTKTIDDSAAYTEY